MTKAGLSFETLPTEPGQEVVTRIGNIELKGFNDAKYTAALKATNYPAHAVLAPLQCTPNAARVKYRRREPEKTLLYRVVEEYLDPFVAEAQERSPDGDGLPAFVEREFRNYLNCGVLSRGFCRVVCSSCGDEKVVTFSAPVAT